MIKCIVIDDEKPARDDLIYYLDKEDDLEVIGVGKNGIEALELIEKFKPQVIFTDISMPLMNGIELAQKISAFGIDIHLIFVTAYNEYAIKAFELNAIDYLLKPLRDDRINQTLSKIKNLENKDSQLNKLDSFLEKYNSQNTSSSLCLYKDGVLYPIKLDQILCIYVEDKTVKIDTIKGQFECYKTLSELEQIVMPQTFFKCHRSYIINLNFIESIEPWFNRTYRVKLESLDKEIPISRKYAQTFKHIMNIL